MNKKSDRGQRKFVPLACLCLWCGCVLAASNTSHPAPSKEHLFQSIALAAVALLGAGLLWKKRSPLAVDASKKGTLSNTLSTGNGRVKLAEEDDFAEFVAEFRPNSGPSPVAQHKPAAAAPKPATAEPAPNLTPALRQFFAWVPDQNAALHRLAVKCRKSKSPVERHAALVEISDRLAELKKHAVSPDLRPAWELATAMEGLLKQLTRSDSNNNQSTTRTVEDGLALLADLCAPEVRSDLSANPAIKILVVDDDDICRLALTSAIKRVFAQPDLAASGEAALEFAKNNHYDLIMLDVMMPGMDGFELCAKIRETLQNRATPVIFITALKDFDSRSRLYVTGGNEVMGKPFMAFEVTVKALTMILRSRVRAGKEIHPVARQNAEHSNPSVNFPKITEAAGIRAEEVLPGKVELPENPEAKEVPQTAMPPAIFATKPDGSPTGQLSAEFQAYVPSFVTEMKQRTAAMGETDEAPLRTEMAARLHLRLQSLSRRINVRELHPAFELCRSLEGLFKKFMENPKNITDTSLQTVNTALDLLKDLCRSGVRSSLAQDPPIRLLVVDDEPLARRALTGALQMAFYKPFTAETAETALEMADEHAFDLIFMDVCMPGLDGFTACTKIHEIPRNQSTPIVFVTSLSDEEFRTRAMQSGGVDFVVKPFIFMEINLKALTMVLRGRLTKDETGAAKKDEAAQVPAESKAN